MGIIHLPHPGWRQPASGQDAGNGSARGPTGEQPVGPSGSGWLRRWRETQYALKVETVAHAVTVAVIVVLIFLVSSRLL